MEVREVVKITDRKRKILLEDGTSFVLYAGEVRAFHIAAGEDLPAESLQKIREEVLVRRARLRCLNLLKSMDRTEQQLRQRLALDGYPADIIQNALAYVASYHYTDDARYAQTYIRQMAGRKSRRQIEWDLRGKGIDPALIRSAMEALSEEEEDPEMAAAAAFARKKGYDARSATPEERRRLMQQLQRRGFALSAIRAVAGLSDRYTSS